MTVPEVMAQLEAMGDEKVRWYNTRSGAGDDQFGVKMGDIRTLAKKIKTDNDLALELWRTGHNEARLLATLIVVPKRLSSEELDGMVRSATWPQLADWLNSYVVKAHSEKESLRQRWMQDSDPMAARAGWSLTAEIVNKGGSQVDPSALLDRIDAEMATAPDAAKWTMNFCLAAIGIHHPSLRERAITIGERIGAYRDYPVSKGCTSPFAPIWIREMVRRQESQAS